jgi:hypothetical protein
MRAPTSSVMRTGSDVERIVRLRRMVRAERMKFRPKVAFVNMFKSINYFISWDMNYFLIF